MLLFELPLPLFPRKDVSELKSFGSPPPLVAAVMEMVAHLFGCSPEWAAIKNLISETHFGKRYRDFDKEIRQ